MTRAKTKSEARQKRRADDEAARQTRIAARRGLNTVLQFWIDCADKQCLRAKGCRGDVDACFRRYWPQVPEELKVWMRAGITARNKGLSVQEAGRVAEAEVERWCGAHDESKPSPASPDGAVAGDAHAAAADATPATAHNPARIRLL